MKKIPTLLCDFYKVSHGEQYPIGTDYIYSMWIPRSNKYLPQADEVVVVGVQGVIKEYLIDLFNENFFNRPKEEVVNEYARVIKYSLGVENPKTEHIEALHDLGYLPIHIKSLKEGTLAPIKTPILTIENTNKDFYWLTNYLETLLSSQLWIPMTSATIAYQYKKLLDSYAIETTGSTDGVAFQGHDFSLRGMSMESGTLSGVGHLTSFLGTDTIPSISYIEQYYNGNIENELIGTSIPATEHSVMSAYGQTNEFDLFKHLITEVYPTGFFSVVSDTWDFWKVVGEYLPQLKEEIMKRDGRVVIRPDSGNPVDIICGTLEGETELERKGLIECLWDIFGGTVNELGYKVLDPHIGAIYGDSITLLRAEEIVEKLKRKGFASTNVVFGIGSYTYQYNTRDTLGFAMKATYAIVNGEERFLSKDPKTDDGTKKSLTGRVVVFDKGDGIKFQDRLTLKEEVGTFGNLLEAKFVNGKIYNEQSFVDIREHLVNQ